jgi:hypothetical protein
VHIELVKFRRSKDSPFEDGIMLGHDRLLIDAQYEVVDAPIWDWESADRFMLDVELRKEGRI